MTTNVTNRLLKALVALLLIGALAAFFALDGQRYLTLETLQQNRNALLEFTQQHYWKALLIAVAVYTAATAISVPGAVLLSLATGFLFGRWVGTGVIVISATIGAALVFLAARYLFADAMRAKLGGKLRELSDGFARDAFSYLLFLRLVPLFPFWLVNLAPAFTDIRLSTYVAATAIGIIPGAFVFANLGQSLGRIQSTAQLVSPETLGALALLGILALVPVLAKKFGHQKIGEKSS
ncbi:MAG: TVP38/TMEM64 family protein [Methylophilaceae bacterium]|nr:TVP38/TMEM64 family protein [Methylophilaceae bacterium]